MIQPLIKTLFGDSDAAANADTVKNFLFHKVVCTGSADAQNILNLINRIGSLMAIVYATLIIKGRKTIDQVPALLRKQVEEILADLEVEV